MKCVPLSDEVKVKEERPKGRPDLPQSKVKYRTIRLKCSDNIKLLETDEEEKEVEENEVDELLANSELEPSEDKEVDSEMEVIKETFSRYLKK